MSDLFDYQQKYPDAPGYKATDTSRKAAQSVAPDAGRLRKMCIAIMEKSRDGLTADEAADALGESVLSIRPRFSELLRGAAIMDSGLRRKNISGRSAIVWVITKEKSNG